MSPPESAGSSAAMSRFVTDFQARGPDARLLVLTGAGISAESGIPTFRGDDGYWTVGSRNYSPLEIATYRMFRREPEVVWAWYLARIAACCHARPNVAHDALVRLERSLGRRCSLVTQNVDGLHGVAGSNSARTRCIHGDFRFVRLAGDEHAELLPLDPTLYQEGSEAQRSAERGERRAQLSEAERELLCRDDGRWLRPHVLWFDEMYDERWFHFESCLRLASECDGFVVIGTSGATNLPLLMLQTVVQRGVPMLVIGPEETVFSEAAEQSGLGGLCRSTAVGAVPPLVSALLTGD